MLGRIWRSVNRWLLAGAGESGTPLSQPLSRSAHEANSQASTVPTVAYVAFLLSLIAEPVQRALIYLHPVRIPFHTDFSKPELVGFAPGKVLPFNLTTEDGAVLGAWQVLPREVYERVVEETHGELESMPEGPLPPSVFDAALA